MYETALEELRRLRAEVHRLQEGVERAIRGDVRVWTAESKPGGAFAECVHHVHHSEDCENCITDYLQKLLEGYGA